jgi:uncharacterized protein YcbK (DUF882 family)
MRRNTPMGDWSKNFDKKEFKCPCCGKFIQVDRLVSTLQAIRDAAGAGVIISSGTRCAKYNASLPGSAAISGHLTGEAADIYVRGWDNRKLYQLIQKIHAEGKVPDLTYSYRIVGKSQTAVHVGVDKKSRKSIWGS